MTKSEEVEGGSDEPSDSERRVASRQFACFPVHIEVGSSRKRTAVIRDLSTSGVLLLSRARIKVGESVSLALYLTADMDAPVQARGKVVRSEKRPNDQTGLWPQSLAVQFDEPLTEHQELIRAIAEKQAEMGFEPA